jgi:hypothetical protein
MQEEQARQGASRLQTLGTRHAAATEFYLCGRQSGGLPPVWRPSKEPQQLLRSGASCASCAADNNVSRLLPIAHVVICPPMPNLQ